MHRKLLPCAAEVGKRAPQGNFDFNILLRSSGATRIHDMVGKLQLGASWLPPCGFSALFILHLLPSSSYFDAQQVVY